MPLRIPTKAATDSNFKAATDSNFKAATIPIRKWPGWHRLAGPYWSSHSGAGRVKRECAAWLKGARHLSVLAAEIFGHRALVASVTPRWLDVRKFR